MKSPLARFAYAIAFLLVGTYAIITLRGPKGLQALVDKQTQIQEMERHNAEMARDLEQERERIKRLTDNASTQDLEIQNRLKLVHPGEKVYITGHPQAK
jgi:cell division protein FtsB